MRIAIGLRAHSGWAALVALGAASGETPALVDRRRIELCEPDDTDWAKAPYHAAEGLELDEAEPLVKSAIASARKLAVRELRAAAKRARADGHELCAFAVLVNEPMPDWSVAEVLAVHFRMHKAEGALFRDSLARAAEACGVPLVAIREKELGELAEQALDAPGEKLAKTLAALGKDAGPPWGADQKQAALAAWVALRASPGPRARSARG